MPRAAYQMPVRKEKAARVGPRLWRKTVLRKGHISKDGIELDVDRPYMESLVRSFTDGAKDQVQLVFANARNQHDESPERFRGSVVDLAVTDDDRLEALVAVTPRGDKVLADNPELGVSPSLEPRFSRADGRTADAVLLHLCATLDPEISKLGAWSRADLSADYDEVIDLTSAEVTAVSGDSASHAAAGSGGDPSQPEGGAPVPTLTDEDRQLLSGVRDLLPGLTSLVTRFNDNGDSGDTDEGTDDQTADRAGGKAGGKATGKGPDGKGKPGPATKPTDAAEDTSDDADDEVDDDGFTEAELDAMAAGVDYTGDDAEGGDGQALAASAASTQALQLANARIDELNIRNARLERRDRQRDYEALVRRLATEDGVPPVVTELCRPLLEGDGRLQLSAGKSINPAELVVKALKEFAKVGPLDLSAPVGTSHEVAAEEARRNRRDQFIADAHAAGFAH